MKSGEIVGFDAEFVSVETEKSTVNADGLRVISTEGRQVVARISLIDYEEQTILDDYVLPNEPIVDYVTRFSGLTPEDLDPKTSPHAIVSNRTIYLKLRYFVDSGCIFVGHGLKKDFETGNIFVPPEQVKDTVELWRLPHQRKISLRFLASYLLKAQIQDEIHDSIEDSKTALALYKHYLAEEAKGPEHLNSTLNDLYAYGNKTNWTIGIDSIDQLRI